MALPAGRYGVTKNQLLKIKKLPMNTIKLIEDLYEKYSLLGSAAFKNSTSVVTSSSDLVESGAVKDIVGWGNKNNLSIPTSVSTQSINGIDYTFHRNSDGAVTKIDVVGTATSDSRLAWNIPDTFVQDETYKLTGWDVRSITQGKVVNFAITFMGVQGSRYILNATDTEMEYTCNKTGYSSIENAIYVQTGTTIDASIYPMNRKATVSDSTFEPYHESVKDTLRDAEVIEGKNLIPLTISAIKSMNNEGTWSGNTYTRRGVTFTLIPYEDDYVARIVVNGTATGGNSLLQLPIVDVSKGSYLGSSGIAYSTTSAFVQARAVGDTYEYLNFNTNGVAINNKNIDQIFCAVISGNSVSNVSLYPMIREATETDPTYEPYYVPLKDVVPQKADNSVIGTVEGANASKAWSVGEHFISGGQFKEVTQPISSGGAINDSNTVDKPIADCLVKQATFSGTTQSNGNFTLTTDNIVLIAIKGDATVLFEWYQRSQGGYTVHAKNYDGTDHGSTAVSGTYYYI